MCTCERAGPGAEERVLARCLGKNNASSTRIRVNFFSAERGGVGSLNAVSYEYVPHS